jgi:hypothetical protein
MRVVMNNLTRGTAAGADVIFCGFEEDIYYCRANDNFFSLKTSVLALIRYDLRPGNGFVLSLSYCCKVEVHI